MADNKRRLTKGDLHTLVIYPIHREIGAKDKEKAEFQRYIHIFNFGPEVRAITRGT